MPALIVLFGCSLSAEIEAEWPAVLEMLARCRQKVPRWFSEPSNAALLDGVLAGRMQLLVSSRMACITTVVDYPAGRVCKILACGGDLEQIRELVPALQDWARVSMRCDGIEVPHGRPGWADVLPWPKTGIVLRYEL